MNRSRGEQSKELSLFVQEETIEEQLLLKASQLHESLRNRRMLHFEYLEASLMKEHIRKKCEQIQQLNRELQDEETQKEEEIEQLQRQTKFYLEKISRQKQAKIMRQKQIDMINTTHHTLKIQCKKKIQELNRFMGRDKQNQNGLENNRFISLEKLNLEADNLSKELIINTLKQDVSVAKQRLKQKQQIRLQLKIQYEKLLKAVEKQEKGLKIPKQETKIHISTCQLNEKDVYQIRKPSKKQRNKPGKLKKQNCMKEFSRLKTGQPFALAKIL